LENELVPVVGIFDAVDTNLFTKYRVKATFTDLVLGGVPQKAEIIDAWLRKRLKLTDERDEIMQEVANTLRETGVPFDGTETDEDIIEASKKVMGVRQGNTFRRDSLGGLYLSNYQAKSMLKEATNISFAGAKNEEGKRIGWGPTKKGPKAFLAERVFVDEQRVYLGRQEPDGTMTQIGHVTGPQGPRSTLTYIDYCVQPHIEMTVSSFQDSITDSQWFTILELSQRLGLGALRSMSHGQFKVTAFDRL